jgi:hypothetical protein
MNKRVITITVLVMLTGVILWTGIAYGQSRTNPNWEWMNNDNTMYASMFESNDMMGNSMMSGGMLGAPFGTSSAEPMSIDAASYAVSRYIAALDDDKLSLGEVMIFDNHAYAQVLNSDTGSGAFELLIDAATGNVYPEPGPNMMWNTAYSPMAGMDMMGGGPMGGNMMDGGLMDGNMMDGFAAAPEASKSISAEDAIIIANRYLEQNSADTIAEDPITFPGYYTLHIEHDGEISSMLSVNAYSGQVFIHHWHGNFIEMSSEDHS